MSRISNLRTAVASSSKLAPRTAAPALTPSRRIHGGPYSPGPLLGPGGFDSAVNPVHSTMVPYVIEQTVRASYWGIELTDHSLITGKRRKELRHLLEAAQRAGYLPRTREWFSAPTSYPLGTVSDQLRKTRGFSASSRCRASPSAERNTNPRSTTKPLRSSRRNCSFSRRKTPANRSNCISTHRVVRSLPVWQSTTRCSTSPRRCIRFVWAWRRVWVVCCWRAGRRGIVLR